MMKEAKTYTNVRIGVGALWTSFTEDLRFLMPKIVPNLVQNVEMIEGDGGLDTVYLLCFGSDKSSLGYQKEKVVVFNETLHQFGLQVIEGGHLNHGFSSYTTVFQLTAVGESESETLVDIKVGYETLTEETNMPEETTKSSVAFIKCLAAFLLKNGSLPSLEKTLEDSGLKQAS